MVYDNLSSDNPVLILLFDELHNIMTSDDSKKTLSVLQNALIELNLKDKNIMFVATCSEDIFYKNQNRLDSIAEIFEPCLIEPLSYEELCKAINVPAKKQDVIFNDDVLKEIYELSNGIPYYMQILAYSCFEEVNEDNRITMAEFKKAIINALNILAQDEFRRLFKKSTAEERKIVYLMAVCSENVLSYSYIKDKVNLNSEPSSLLKNLVNKDILVKPSRGKYKLKNSLFKLYVRNLMYY